MSKKTERKGTPFFYKNKNDKKKIKKIVLFNYF